MKIRRILQPATLVFCGLSILCYVLLDPSAFETYGTSFESLTKGNQWTLFTSGFIHLNLEHLISNLTIIFLAGYSIELRKGSKVCLQIILLGLLFGALGGVLEDQSVYLIGSSGVLFAMLGSSAMLDIPQTETLKNKTTELFLSPFFLLLIAGLVFTIYTPGVSLGGHVGGTIAGLVIGSYLIGKENHENKNLKSS